MEPSKLLELKLRKRLLAQQLSVIESRCERLNGILQKKELKRQGVGVETPDKAACAIIPTQKSLDTRGPPHQRRGRHERAEDNAQPRPEWAGLGEAAPAAQSIVDRRRHYLLQDVRRKGEAEKEKRREARAAASRKPVSSKPNVPKSFFPSRYERGELPCTITFKSAGEG
jgi:hypothetical protein